MTFFFSNDVLSGLGLIESVAYLIFVVNLLIRYEICGLKHCVRQISAP